MTWLVVVAIVVALDVLTIAGLRLGIGRTFRPLTDRYPPREPAPDAVHRRFQSFRLGFINLGWSIHVAADETHLHLVPAALARLVGCRPLSIPWSAMRVTRRSRNGRWAKVRLEPFHTLEGPAWCLDLAGSAEDDKRV